MNTFKINGIEYTLKEEADFAEYLLITGINKSNVIIDVYQISFNKEIGQAEHKNLCFKASILND